MSARGNHVQLNHMFSADLETCDDIDKPIYKLVVDNESGLIEPIYPQKVWLGGLMNIETKEMTYFQNIDFFMEKLLERGTNQNREVAMHNLRFDGSFIVPWLLRNGYIVSHEKPKAKEFSVLIDKMNNWYSIRIQVTKRRRITIWDSAKLFPMKLERLPDLYGTPTNKLKEDSSFYNYVRPLDHELTDEEIKYFKNDLLVLAEVIEAHVEHYGLLFKKTQASQAFNEFEKSFRSWRRRFPPMEEKEDLSIRRSYWGGISYVNPVHKEKDLYNIGVYDINSSYPYQQAYKKLPYGKMLYEYEDREPDMSKFWIATVIIEFKLKKGKIPCIPKKAIEEGEIFTSEKWLSDSEGIVVLKFCNIDFLLINESYNFKIYEWINVKHWSWRVHPEIQRYIRLNDKEKIKYGKLAKSKVTKELQFEYKSKRQRAKINSNSYYGKFGEEIVKEGKTPYLIENEVFYIQDREEIQKMSKRKFLPVAIATTAWGRFQLVSFANLLGDSFIYCDTDSVHYLREEGDEIIKKAEQNGVIKIDSEKLGYWSLEGYYYRGRFLRSKCYYEEKIGSDYPEVTLAGLPADDSSTPKKRSCCTWDNFYIGLKIKNGNGKLQSIRTPTGNKLLPTSFEITEDNYIFGF